MKASLQFPSGGDKGSAPPRRGFILAAIVVVGLPVVLLSPAMRPGHILSSADTLLGSYLFASARPPGFSPENPLLGDPVHQFIPWRQLGHAT